MLKLLNKVQGYRTLALNVGVILTALFGNVVEVSAEEVDSILLGVVTVGNIWLRVYTTTPIGQRPE